MAEANQEFLNENKINFDELNQTEGSKYTAKEARAIGIIKAVSGSYPIIVEIGCPPHDQRRHVQPAR